jgi:glutamate-1-semialdehyde 2,1-aminomutase
MANRKLARNNKLFTQAKNYLVGGVNSPVRSFKYVGGGPLLFKNGKGAKIYDYDGNSYIDYVLSWGSLILGHNYPPVTRNLRSAISLGLGFGATNQAEIELAKIICDAVPFIDKIRFVNSGTEAVMSAIRLARAYSRRDYIIKFENSYHGHADYLLAKSGSGLATFNLPLSAGVPKDFLNYTLISQLGDLETVTKLFRKYGHKIAAVIVEPAGANFGVIPAQPDFLNGLRRLTKNYDALLIFDEVVTGFRFHFGSLAQKLSLEPDLICLGKIIGGGLPVGAYGGRQRIMRQLAPLGKVYQASTFSGNPIVMAAGIATLNALKKNRNGSNRLAELAEYLSLSLSLQAKEHNIEMKVPYYGSMFSFEFKHIQKFREFFHLMLKQGIYFAPSPSEANFLSFAHKKADIQNTITAAGSVFDKI